MAGLRTRLLGIELPFSDDEASAVCFQLHLEVILLDFIFRVVLDENGSRLVIVGAVREGLHNRV